MRIWKIETFLPPPLYIYMRADQAFPSEYWGPIYRSIVTTVRFPDICVGCAIPTSAKREMTFRIKLKYVQGAITQTLDLLQPFNIPLCIACDNAKLGRFVSIKSNVLGNIPDPLCVLFKFPNIAFYEPFAEVNNLDPKNWLSYKRLFPKQTSSDITLYEKLKKDWELVQKRFGVHQYLAAKEKLINLNNRFGWLSRRKNRQTIKNELNELLREYEWSIAELKEVQKIMGIRLPIIEMIDEVENE
jgi:hypothetical protein